MADKSNVFRLAPRLCAAALSAAVFLPFTGTAREAVNADSTATNKFSGDVFLKDFGAGCQVNFNSSYTAPSSTKFGPAGNSGAFDVNLGVGKRFRLDDEWSLQLDLGSDNLFLDSIPGAPIPGSVHTIRFGGGLSYRLDDQWMITGMVRPMLYRLDNLQGNDVGVTGGLLAMYRANPKLAWSFGIIIAPDSDVPVLPIAGVNWMINDRFTLQLMFPKPRLIYRGDRHWSLYTGLDMVGTTFRTEEDFGSKIGLPQYNHALATYRDVRLGAGVQWRFFRGLKAELETGASVYREINYTRLLTLA